ncbi:unnamed protein product [Prunus brigantina]
MGVVTAFGMAGLGEPSYEQFSYLYSITRSKCADHGGWVQANCLRAAERGHFISHVPTSQKSWRNRRVLLSGDWESPLGHSVRFHIPTTFQIAGKLKQPVATQAEIRQIDQVRLKVPAVERVYPQLLFTPNLIKAQLAHPTEMTEERRAAEAKRLSESSKRRLMMGLQGQKKKKSQQETVPPPSAGANIDDQSLADCLRQMSSGSGQPGPAAPGPSPCRGAHTEGDSSRAAGKRVPRAIFSVEDDDGPADPVDLACPAKTVQFANHMILGSQMELSEIEELPKKLIREEAGRAFRLQASVSLSLLVLTVSSLSFGIADIRLLFSRLRWICGCASSAPLMLPRGRRRPTRTVGPRLPRLERPRLAKDLQAAERQVKYYEAKFAEMSAALESAQLMAKEALEAKEAVQVALEESERTKALEIEAAIRGYRRSSEFSTLLDSEVGEEMAGMLYRFKRYNPGKKLNLNFIADPPPLPEGITEEMIEEYEGEVAPEPEAEEPTANATEEENEPPAVEEAA